MEYRFLTLDTVTIDPRYLDEPSVTLGDGIDLSNPGRMLVAPCRAFAPAPEVRLKGDQDAGLATAKSSITENAKFLEGLSEKEESQVLSAHFKASYMLSSVEAAGELAAKEKETSQRIYVLIEHAGESERLEGKLRKWVPDLPPVSETIEDDDEALRQFVCHYGTHYVSTIKYGLRIGVQGKLMKTSKSEGAKLSVSFKAAFGSFAAEGGAETENEKTLKKENVNLLLEATSGGREDGGLLVAQGFDDIHRLLSEASTGKIKFHVAPIEMTLKPYWPTLDPTWERTRKLLDPANALDKLPGAPYGVPEGTILAWHPTADFWTTDVLQPPSGWAICDGKNGTPDLSGRFLRGFSTVKEFQENPHMRGGTTEHDHGSHSHTMGAGTKFDEVTNNAGPKHQASTSEHVHTVKEAESSKSEHLPPFVSVVYIMKL